MENETCYEQAHQMVERIFREEMPKRGFALRKEQLALCHEMVEALWTGSITLCDAGVGVGKTYAYLVACFVWQIFGPPALPHTVVISTSSVALQKAILKEYIPFLSDLMMEIGFLKHPIRAALRKGKERFVCDVRLSERRSALQFSHRSKGRKDALYALERTMDLDEVIGLAGFDRRLVCVPDHCPADCEARTYCRYQHYLKISESVDISIQICNHNYLLADAMHRQQGMRPLLKAHHVLVVDEAHKLPEAARQMYSKSIAPEDFGFLCDRLEQEHCYNAASWLRKAQNELTGSFLQRENLKIGIEDPVVQASLQNVRKCLQKIANRFSTILSVRVLCQLNEMEERVAAFCQREASYVYYLKCSRDGKPTFYAADRKEAAHLAKDLWASGTPAILTSGTLSSGGCFDRMRQMLGLDQVKCAARIRSFTADSPFDYKSNCLLYFPDQQEKREKTEVDFLTKEIEELTKASHGHALVLFTSYRQMNLVFAKLQDKLPFPVLKMWKNGHELVQRFKNLPNGVLMAAGPCWEGVDFPGDMVSLLVITRLPFPIPDAVRDAEKRSYQDLHEYIQAEILPDMQRKLRQGFGRSIRTETDTCAVAILDERAIRGGRYHQAVLDALPSCPITNHVEEVAEFIREKKTESYFK